MGLDEVNHWGGERVTITIMTNGLALGNTRLEEGGGRDEEGGGRRRGEERMRRRRKG